MSQDKSRTNREINNIDEFHSWALDMQKRVQEFGSQFKEPHIVNELIEECLRQETFDEVLLKPKFEYIQTANNERVSGRMKHALGKISSFFTDVDHFERSIKYQYPVDPEKECIKLCEKELKSLNEVPDTDLGLKDLTKELLLAKDALIGKGYFPIWRHMYNFSCILNQNNSYFLDIITRERTKKNGRKGGKKPSVWKAHEDVITDVIITKIIGEGLNISTACNEIAARIDNKKELYLRKELEESDEEYIKKQLQKLEKTKAPNRGSLTKWKKNHEERGNIFNHPTKRN
jgi:hypothetical protein